jgi:conjugative relaxase-like TrwC/TraI family protein
MLSIAKIAAGPKAARYYTDQVARDRDDYYTGEGEEPGRWTGSAAGSVGLSGEVDDDRFAQLLAGAGLRKPPSEGAVAGFDLTFRAPKSVSVLWAAGSPEVVRELRAAHDAAVEQALGYLEREACWARRGKGGLLQVKGRGFVAAAFMHRASRAGDPLLHTHVVVGNLTQGPDGRWTALDARHLYRQGKTGGYLYQAVLRRELTERLGVEWYPVERGVADVVGVPRAVIEHFSQRRQQILEHMADHGGRSAASAQIAALETRRPKQDAPLDRLRADWRARATEHGLDDRAIAAVFGRVRQLELNAPDVLRELTEHQSTFGRPEILQALAQAHGLGATVAELERQADALLADREVVRLADGRAPAGLSEARLSTREMLAVEKALVDAAVARTRERVARANPRALTKVLDEDGTLSDEQRQVVRELCDGKGGVIVLRAAAGTGKTFALDAAREAWNAATSMSWVVRCPPVPRLSSPTRPVSSR